MRLRSFCLGEGQGELEDASCAHTCEETSAPEFLLAGEKAYMCNSEGGKVYYKRQMQGLRKKSRDGSLRWASRRSVECQDEARNSQNKPSTKHSLGKMEVCEDRPSS